MTPAPANPPIAPTAALADRLRRAGEVAAAHDTDLLLVTPGTDLRYLLGASGESHERLTCLVLPAAGHRAPPALVVPRLEAPGLAGLPLDELGVEVITWRDGEDPYLLVSDLAGGPTRVAVVDSMPAAHVFGLRDALPAVEQTLAGPVLRELRMRKDAAEVAELRAAGAAIDRVHARMAEFLKPGRTEEQVGADIAAAIVAEGHTSAAFVIVGSGPNGASPHHDVSDRVIESGDVVVIDIGGPLPSGYNSDSTRTYAVGAEPPAAVREAYAVLQNAQERAVAAVRPGVTAEQVDAAAREPITAAGLGERFVHRTGHGIGLDVHEEPYIVGGNTLPLEPGMAFSVEPGVYLDGEWGARIEDIVVVTDDGCERLNSRPRDLVVL
jgi:Xaa-Pro aminopeptidase